MIVFDKNKKYDNIDLIYRIHMVYLKALVV